MQRPMLSLCILNHLVDRSTQILNNMKERAYHTRKSTATSFLSLERTIHCKKAENKRKSSHKGYKTVESDQDGLYLCKGTE